MTRVVEVIVGWVIRRNQHVAGNDLFVQSDACLEGEDVDFLFRAPDKTLTIASDGPAWEVALINLFSFANEIFIPIVPEEYNLVGPDKLVCISELVYFTDDLDYFRRNT